MVADATVAVFDGDKRVGSAVLVDGRHLLTAAHVVHRWQDGRRLLREGLAVYFPIGRAEGASCAVSVMLLDSENAVDVAVLHLDALPHALPPPVGVYPARRLPPSVDVLGFPFAEKDAAGIWRRFDVAGPVAGQRQQLDWITASGTLPGHSGGPVVAVDSSELVGILVEGSEKGRFDRFVPVSAIARRWPGLRVPWLMVGQDGRGHVTRRGRGQRAAGRGGDLFRGRAHALDALHGWLTSGESRGGPLVVTGQPGAGKSAVVARTALQLEDAGVGPGLVFHARGATHLALLEALADLLGTEGLLSREMLFEQLDDNPSGLDVWLVIIDALDEAATSAERAEMITTLNALAAYRNVRVAVATRPLAAGNRYLPGAVLPALGIDGPDSAALIDLDSEAFFDLDGLRNFAAAVLCQDAADRPGPPGAAWTAYRNHPQQTERLAEAVARRADRNYLVAALGADPLARQQTSLDPAAADFDVAAIPASLGEALSKYLDQPSLEPRRARIRGLLLALAYARGDGVDDRLWLAFAAALGYPADIEDLDWLRDSAAADYLLQNVSDPEGPATRLFHQALNDELLARRPNSARDERVLLITLQTLAESDGWASAPLYVRRHLGAHAAAVGPGELSAVLHNLNYVSVADVARLLPLLTDATALDPIVLVLRQAGMRVTSLPPDRRLGLLALTAARLGLSDLQRQLNTATPGRWPVLWGHSAGAAHREITGHAGAVNAVALGRIGDHDVIVTGGRDRTVRVWDADTGAPRGRSLTNRTGPVTAVTLGRVEDRGVIVSGSSDGTVRVWDADTVEPRGKPLAGHARGVSAVALGLVGDRSVIVSGSWDGTVRGWDADTGEQLGKPLTGHIGQVTSLVLGRVGGHDVVVTGGRDRTVRVWDANTGEPHGKPLTGRAVPVTAVALGRVGDRDVIVSGRSDGPLQVWDANTGEPLGRPLTGHTGSVTAVALDRVGDRTVIVSGSNDGTVRVWDANTRGALGRPLTGHTGSVTALALGRVNDRDIVVTSSDDGTVRVWEPDPVADAAAAPSRPLTSHGRPVSAVALGLVGAQDVIVSGSIDRAVRVWDADTGARRGSPLGGHSRRVSAVALGRVGDRDVIVSGSWDRTVQVWDADTGARRGRALTGHTGQVSAVALGRVGDRDVIVSGSWDRTVQVWDANTGARRGRALTGHTGQVSAVALGRVGDRDVIVSGSWDRTVQVWDADTGAPRGGPLMGHTRQVSAVALGRGRDRDIVVTGSWDRTVLVWDAGTGELCGRALTGHTGQVSAVALGRVGDRDIVVTGSDDGTVRVWDADTGEALSIHDLSGPVIACALNSHILGVAVGSGLCALRVERI